MSPDKNAYAILGLLSCMHCMLAVATAGDIATHVHKCMQKHESLHSAKCWDEL